MDEFSYWLLAGLVLSALVFWLGYKSLKRTDNKDTTTSQPIAVAPKSRNFQADDQPETQPAAALLQGNLSDHDVDAIRTEHLAEEESTRIAVETARLIQAAADKVAAEKQAQAQAQAQAEAEAARAAALAAQAKLAVEQAQRQAAIQAAEKEAVLAAQAAALLETQRKQAEAEAEAEASAAAAAAAAAALKKPKAPQQTIVMIADDSKLVRIKTGRLLAQHDYQILYALDGQDAAQQMQTTVPDILITDVEMPGMDGFALSNHVRNTPATAHIPIIMITAADSKHRDEADRVGVSVLMGKPYSDEELVNHIRLLTNHIEALV
jgi:PleD family two-component response regulator